jgi:Ca-activated chloride channel family protein
MGFASRVAALAAALPLALVPAAEACMPANRSALLIFDASSSMTAKVPSGQARIDVARRAVEDMIRIFPPEGHIALRVYGSESPFTRMNCQDTKLLVPFAPAAENAAAIVEAIWGVPAQGLTPIAYALEQARGDFPGDAEDRVIVIVSDGRETCNGNPCAVAAKLAGEGFVIHTIGFVVERTAALQLKCISTVSGGTYFDVPVAVDLPDKLKEVFQACPVSGLPPRPGATALARAG